MEQIESTSQKRAAPSMMVNPKDKKVRTEDATNNAHDTKAEFDEK